MAGAITHARLAPQTEEMEAGAVGNLLLPLPTLHHGENATGGSSPGCMMNQTQQGVSAGNDARAPSAVAIGASTK